jgi:hypothetical protein
MTIKRPEARLTVDFDDPSEQLGFVSEVEI